MKFFGVLAVVALATQSVSAHYIYKTLIAGSKTSTQAVRQPQNSEPLHDPTVAAMTCNLNPGTAGETVSLNGGDKIGFQLNTPMYHQGPVAIYIGKAPGKAADWDGSGANWVKIAEWGPSSYSPMKFSTLQMTDFVTTIPVNTPSGEYLARIENMGLHLGTGVPELFVSCGQIKVTNKNGNPVPLPGVAIPGHIAKDDKDMTVNIYDSSVKSFRVPGPTVWRG